jgi:hypothetical protein
MSRAVRAAEISEPDLIDRIANALPAELRADYYREMRHCRSLPENDEMLRILRAMQFLTLLTIEVPERLIAEREALDKRLNQIVDAMEKWLERSEVYQRNLDERLTQLSSAIANDINPQAIAGKINENLRQQFVQSTIPQTGETLAAVAKELRKITAEFAETAKSLGDKYTGAVEEARLAVRTIESTISSATAVAKRAASDLSETFCEARRWSVYTICIVSIGVGLVLGAAITWWIWPAHQNESANVAAQQVTSPPLKKVPGGAGAHDPRHVGR